MLSVGNDAFEDGLVIVSRHTDQCKLFEHLVNANYFEDECHEN
jgi:hypothetical protein